MRTEHFLRLALISLLALRTVPAHATGYYGPMVYLDEGGRNVGASPEFYWELEVKRLARDFHPPEKLLTWDPASTAPNDDPKSGLKETTAAADLKDFATALQEGRIKPPDPAEATREHGTARAVIDRTSPTSTEALPAEFSSEFALYHRGAFAYARGPEHWGEARQAWEELLQRPAPERHDRSVWAAFMLGKLALKEKDPAATGWFQRTRALAREGFADSLGMAADSYGWEGRSEWKQGHPEKAAPLYLNQLSLGEESAIVSLKALIPDREPVEGMVNYGPEAEEKQGWNKEQGRVAEEKARADLNRAALDPLLRRLVTVHILATASVPDAFTYYSSKPVDRSARWLAIINDLHLDRLEDAEYIGWVAYNKGDYKGAKRWLELSGADSPAALWLRAKLQNRAGKLAEAAQSMARAWEILRDTHAYTGWRDATTQGARDPWSDPHWTLAESAAGDFGALHLERSDFVQALDTLLAGGLWNDAAFVAERVLTLPELQGYVDQHPPGEKDDPASPLAKLRYLLGRRLVREDQAEQARAYLAKPFDQVVDRYLAALREGRDRSRSKTERARSLFAAAWLARYDGMELMGTEGAPDGFATGGNFPLPDLAQQFRSGHYEAVDYSGAEATRRREPVVLRVPPKARQRLTRNKTIPDLRFHYRVIAGALALQAAELLPNDSEELADAVNRAGLWVKDVDEKLGNRYYQVIERRAAQTTIGKAALARHWFVEQSGPWSAEQQQAHDTMRRELNFPPEN